MKNIVKICFSLIILFLATSCSSSVTLNTLSKKIEKKSNIRYPVQGSKLIYSNCNIKMREEFLESVIKNSDIDYSINNIFIEFHDNKKIYFALMVKDNLSYYEREDFLNCISGKEIFFPKENEHNFEKLIKHILLDLGKGLSYDNLINESLINKVSDAGPVYITVFDIIDKNSVKIKKSLKINQYYNPKYDEWPSID
ncbi:hypothetical protein [Aequorivita sp. CIP111184]|uniref:hypothetical protein n=1 Tax=Aequorivita sp. CIP111184 TaxID=2211356 RepID=UPI000DBC3C73|nr:hypothetical protein [Aequorivita sp. CIP111184]SRX52255.1 hypothetical protein AEQU1_00118 [Aequorivita sp. CIP111184]